MCWCVLAGERAGQDSCLYLVLASVLGNLITSSQLRNNHLHMVLTCIAFDLMSTYDGFLLRWDNVISVVSSVGDCMLMKYKKTKQIATLMPSHSNLIVDMRNLRFTQFTQDLVLCFRASCHSHEIGAISKWQQSSQFLIEKIKSSSKIFLIREAVILISHNREENLAAMRSTF